MDKKLDILRHLYGEVDDRAARRALLQDEEVAREYQAMGEVKFLLDHRPRRRPDPQVLQAILAAAETGAPPVAMRSADRAPVARRASARWGLFGMVGATAAAAVVALMIWWPPGPAGPEPMRGGAEERASADAAVATAPSTTPPSVAAEAEAVFDSAFTVARASAAPAQEAAVQAQDAVVQWEAADELLKLHRQIETLEQYRLGLAWDEPLQPLGPSGRGGSLPGVPQGLREASQRRQ